MINVELHGSFKSTIFLKLKLEKFENILEVKFKDITLSIQTNKNTINKQIKFTDAFPISIGDLSFTTQDTSVEYLTCAVSFRYNRFEFIR